MKQVKFLALLTLLVFAGTPVLRADEDDRNRASKEIEISDYDVLEVNLPCDVHYVPTLFSAKMKIVADKESSLDYILVEQDGNTLVLSLDKEARLKRLGDVDVYVSSRKLRSVSVNGACDFEAEQGIRCDDSFNMKVNGAGDADIHGLHADEVTVRVNGAGDLDIDGLNCKSLILTINGAGDAELHGTAKEADIKINGAGDVDIVDLKVDKLSSSVNGVGKVRSKRR